MLLPVLSPVLVSSKNLLKEFPLFFSSTTHVRKTSSIFRRTEEGSKGKKAIFSTGHVFLPNLAAVEKKEEASTKSRSLELSTPEVGGGGRGGAVWWSFGSTVAPR